MNLGKVRRVQTVKIKAGGHRSSLVIIAIPSLGVITGLQFSIHQQTHLTAQNIMNAKFHLNSLGQIKLDHGRGIEGIGVIEMQGETLG